MKKHLSVFILSILILMTLSINVYAASSTKIQPYGYHSQHFDIDYDTYTSGNYWMGMNNAHYNWNHPYAMLGGSEVFLETSSLNKVYLASYPGDYYGIYSVLTQNSNTFNKTTKFSISYNTRLVLSNKSVNFMTSVATHEIGHGLGLDDDNIISVNSIMYNSRNRETIYVPWYTDCYGVYDNWNR